MSKAKGSAAGRLTRGQVAKALGLSVASVRRMEGSLLHPVVEEQTRVHYFDAIQVQAVAASRPGRAGAVEVEAGASEVRPESESARAGSPDSSEARRTPGVAADAIDPGLAAEVFEDLDGGTGLTAIVRKRRVSPTVVMSLAESWKAMKAAGLSTPSVPKAVAELERSVREIREDLAQAWQDLSDTPALALRTRFKCPACEASGLVAVQVSCTNCGHQTTFGFHPKGPGGGSPKS